MRAFACLFISAAFFIAGLCPLSADEHRLTISTNNTPIDRQVLTRVAEAAFGQLGYAVEITSLPSERSLRAADRGEVDGEGLRVAGLDDQYPNLVAIPEKFTTIRFVAFATDPDLQIAGWESLAAHRVAFITGWKMFERNAGGAGSVVKVDEPGQMFRMLQAGRVDLALYTEADGTAFLHDNGISGLAMLAPPLAEVDMYLYLNRAHGALAGPAAEEVRRMKADGRYEALLSDLVD